MIYVDNLLNRNVDNLLNRNNCSILPEYI